MYIIRISIWTKPEVIKRKHYVQSTVFCANSSTSVVGDKYPIIISIFVYDSCGKPYINLWMYLHPYLKIMRVNTITWVWQQLMYVSNYMSVSICFTCQTLANIYNSVGWQLQGIIHLTETHRPSWILLFKETVLPVSWLVLCLWRKVSMIYITQVSLLLWCTISSVIIITAKTSFLPHVFLTTFYSWFFFFFWFKYHWNYLSGVQSSIIQLWVN